MSDIARRIAGYLTHNPGPGIYSRLERAVEAMPENVRVQELPGLLKRYKEGVPGWELKATDLDSTIAGRDVVPRDELLAAVRERSPVYTHKEVVLGGNPPKLEVTEGSDWLSSSTVRPDYQRTPSPLGEGIFHNDPKYSDYSQGGIDYTELLLTQPGAVGRDFGSHWQQRDPLYPEAVAHARFDTHGDALRINELQSDLGIHNRKQREIQPVPSGRDAELIAMKDRRESDAMYIERMRELGHEVARGDDGGWVVVGSQAGRPLPFPMEDNWSDLLIKRLALEAARQGHRAIEIASPRAIADKVGGNIENYEHFYGKVIPGALERLGRKMGGLAEDDGMIAVPYVAERPSSAGKAEVKETIRSMPTSAGEEFAGAPFWKNYSEMMHANLSPLDSDRVYQEFGGYGNYGRSQEMAASDMYERLRTLGYSTQEAQAITSRALFEAPRAAAIQANYANEQALGRKPPAPSGVGRRYIMSDEMRRRLIEQGVGASVLAPLLMQGDE